MQETWKNRADIPQEMLEHEDALKAIADNNRGLCHTANGDYEAALADFEKALTIAPQYAAAQENLERFRDTAE